MNNLHYGVFNEKKKRSFYFKCFITFFLKILKLYARDLWGVFHLQAARIHIVLNVSFIYGSREKNSVWNGMWCCTEVFQSHRLCCWTSLTPARLPSTSFPLGPSSSPSLTSFLCPPPTWREPPFPPHHLHFSLAISPMNKKINKKKTQNHAENLLFLIIARR